MRRTTLISIIIMTLFLAIFALKGSSLTAELADSGKEGEELIGKKAPAWSNKVWLNSKPIKLQDLREKIVLVRWWTDRCSLCERSAPALNEFYSQYSDKGLVVIGMYHPKPFPNEKSIEEIKKASRKLEFKFPIAVDNDGHLCYNHSADTDLNATSNISDVSVMTR